MPRNKQRSRRSPETSANRLPGRAGQFGPRQRDPQLASPYDALKRPDPYTPEIIMGKVGRKSNQDLSLMFKMHIVMDYQRHMMAHLRKKPDAKSFPRAAAFGKYGKGIKGFAAKHGVHASTVNQLVREWTNGDPLTGNGSEGTATWMNKRGGGPAPNALLTKDRIDFIAFVNNKSKRRLSIRRLAKACKREAETNAEYAKFAGDTWSKSTLANHLYRVGAYWHRRYIEPYVTDKHRKDRIQWVQQEIERDDDGKPVVWVEDEKEYVRFREQHDMVHLDEAWFFLLENGQMLRYLPGEKHWKNPKACSKRHLPKYVHQSTKSKSKSITH